MVRQNAMFPLSQMFSTFSMLLGWVHRYVCHCQKFSCNYSPLCHINGTGILDYNSSIYFRHLLRVTHTWNLLTWSTWTDIIASTTSSVSLKTTIWATPTTRAPSYQLLQTCLQPPLHIETNWNTTDYTSLGPIPCLIPCQNHVLNLVRKGSTILEQVIMNLI